MVLFEQFTTVFLDFVTKEKIIFFSWEPYTADFTTFAKLQLKLKISNLQNHSISVTINSQNAVLFSKIIQKVLRLHSPPFIGYNWKTLFTFFQRTTSKPLEIKNVIDLAWYESYKSKPSSVDNKALQIRHFTELVTDNKLFFIYKTVYQPLICQIVPAMESYGLVNENMGYMVYPYYHIEGQENGRLSCSCEFRRCYNPHSLGDDQKLQMQLKSKDHRFLHFDYRNMEVVVLSELAHDDNLKQIIKDGDSKVYEMIFEKITGIKNHENAKNFGKKMFLPVIYGQAEGGLATSLDISREQSSIYIQKLRSQFAKSFHYVEQMQKLAQEKEEVTDEFGRVRRIPRDEAIKARNFAIQSPAALICLEALVNLHNESQSLYDVVFHVHDGYCISGHNNKLQDAYMQARKMLLQTSSFLKNAQFKLSAKVGKNLAKMAEIGK